MKTANKIISVAQGWLGYSETNGQYLEILDVYNSYSPRARGYAIKTTDAWCDAFVSAVAIKAGFVDLIGTEVGVEKHVSIFKEKGIWIEDGTITPKIGDIIVYNWDDNTQPNDGNSDHIGYVENVSDGKIIVIEGNYNDAVIRRTIGIGWGYIRGFARPTYEIEYVPITAKNLNDVAKEVINGVWGNGDARKNALTAAGYDYPMVQSQVNNLLTSINLKSVEELAQEVLNGVWGNGSARELALNNAGYDYALVQAKVNQIIKKSVDDVAHEVIAGVWGNGGDRKNALTEAGYDYNAVQARVNQLL